MTSLSILKRTTAALALMAFSWSSAAFAACDSKTPAAGATVTCTDAAPNPDSGGILSANESSAPANITLIAQTGSIISGVYLGTGANVAIASGASVTGTSVGANRAVDLAGGMLTISGSVASPGAAAILLGNASGSRVTLNQGGTVTSNGGAAAIFANGGNDGFFTVNGTVVTNGNFFGSTGTGASVVNVSNNYTTLVGATGSITTNGNRMAALVTSGTGNSLTVGGTITANGADSAAISLVRNGGATLTNVLVLNAGGNALSTGNISNAIVAQDAAQIDIAGTVRSTGASSIGLQVRNTIAGTIVNVAATGVVAGEGSNNSAINLNGAASTVNIAAGGTVAQRVGSGTSAGIFVTADASNGSVINNAGTISASEPTFSGFGIDARSGGITINNLAGGTISGNTGIRRQSSANSSTVINSGTITGGIDFSPGTANDTLELRAGSNITGLVSFGGGTGDRLVFGGMGDQGFNLALLNHNGTLIAGQQYSGFESFAKNGPGILTLSGAEGAGGASAQWAVDAGTLVANGTLAGSVTVASGATLMGGSGSTTASIGSLTVSSGGTLSLSSFGIPGEDSFVDSLTINGNLVLNAGSNTRLDVGVAGNSSDRILVTGSASLAGSLSAFALSGTFTEGTYTLLTANGGVSGRFDPFTRQGSIPSTASIGLRYDENNVFLEVQSGIFTTTTSERQSIVFTAPVVTTNRVNTFSTQVIGRLLGGQPLYNQTFAFAFTDPTVQNGVTAARAAITAAGGPGVIIGAPVRTASATTSSTVSASTFSLTGSQNNIEAGVVTFGPATLTVDALSICNISSLPSATRPSCADASGTTLVLGLNDTNINVNTNTVHTVAEARTDTVTETLSETYELNGQVVAVGSIHAQVQSGLFDLSGRLLTRLGQIAPGRSGWADAYRFRVSQGGRRDAWGLAGGIALPLGERMTFAAGIGHGNLDIDVTGALETGEVKITELGASLRYDQDSGGAGFGASVALVHGFGKANTGRAIIGRSNAAYDVRATGAALELGYGFENGGVMLRPVAGLDWTRISTDGFTESDTLGLIAGRQGVSRTRATAGLSLAKDFGKVSLALSGRYLAILDGGARSLPVAFALAPTRTLTMTGPSERDGALAGARMAIPLSKAATLSFSYDGRFGGGYRTHAGNIGVRVSF